MSDSEEKNTGILTDPVEEITCEACTQDIDVSECEAFTEVECPVCGCIQTVPAQLAHYRLTRILGTGGMGCVYEAEDVTLNRRVAIKVMLQSLGDDTNFLKTFQKEAQAAAALNHPNVAQVYTFGQEKGQPYIVMELVSGKQFKKMVDEEQPLHQGMVMQIGVDIAESLRAATELGLLHGDVKPENILLDEKGNAKLVDFGLASMAEPGNEGGIWGTPYYIAPEKVLGKTPDERSDLYSLGATLYHALSGRPPFEGDTPIEVVKARLKRPPPELGRVRKDIDERVERVVNRMLEKEPGRRYPNYGSLISDMKRVTQEVGGRRAVGGKASSGRIVFTKKRAVPVMPSSGKTIKTQKRVVAAKDSAQRDGADTKDKKKKQKSGPPVALFIVLGVLLLVGGGAGLFYHLDQKKKKEAAAFEAHKLSTAKSETLALFESISTKCKALQESLAPLDKSESALQQIERLSPPARPAVDAARETLSALISKDRIVIDNFLSQSENIKTQAETATYSNQAKMNQDQITLIEQQLKNEALGIEQRLAKFKEQAGAVEAKHSEYQAQLKKQAERDAEAKAAAARKKAEEDKKRAAEQKKQDDKAAELAKASEMAAGFTGGVAIGGWKQTITQLQKAKDSYNTAAAKDLLNPIIARYQELEDLKKVLAEELGKQAPIRGLWKDHPRARAISIISVTTERILIEGGIAVSWADVTPLQMMPMIRKCIGDPSKAPGRLQADLYFKQAVYFWENNQRNEVMQKLIERAASVDTSYRDKAARMMPENGGERGSISGTVRGSE